MTMRKREDEVFPNAAAVDVGASSHWVAAPAHSTDDAVHEYGVMTADLNVMADWLLACGVDTVVLESTGVYWIPVYEVLEQRGLKVWLVDARQIKYVPGRKSDVQDCQWLQKLMNLGLLRAAFRPGPEVCVLRAVARQRDTLQAEQASWIQRMQKALVQMNIQLGEVLTDVMGVTGQTVIRAIVAGERDPQVLASYRNARVKASKDEIARALQGNWRQEHLFVLAQSLAMYDDIQRHLGECDTKLHDLMAALGPSNVEIGRAPRTGSKARVEFNQRQLLANWAVLSSGTKRAANRARQALKLAAQSLWHSQSALGAFYRRLQARMDTAKANTATAHKLARMVYFMLTCGEAFVDQGQQHYEQQQRERSVAALKRRASSLGFSLTPAATPAQAASV